MNHSRQLEILQKNFLNILFNVEYINSLNIAEIAWLYYDSYCILHRWHFDSHVFIRQLSSNFQTYVKQRRFNFIDAYFPRPWNLICEYLSWTEVMVLSEAFFEKSDHLKAFHSTASVFEKRLALILMPYERSLHHYLHRDATEVLQLTCPERFETLRGLFQAIKNNLIYLS